MREALSRTLPHGPSEDWAILDYRRSPEGRLAEQVRTRRKLLGMSQAFLAEFMTDWGTPMHQSTIAKIEREDDETRRPITLNEATNLARIFGQSLEEMLMEVGKERAARIDRIGKLLAEAEGAETARLTNIRRLRQQLAYEVGRALAESESDASMKPKGRKA